MTKPIVMDIVHVLNCGDQLQLGLKKPDGFVVTTDFCICISNTKRNAKGYAVGRQVTLMLDLVPKKKRK